MQIVLVKNRRSEQGSIVAYFILLLVIVTAIAGVSAFVTQTLSITHRHNEMVEALAFAEGGATLAAAELELALTNQTTTLLASLASNPAGDYSKNTDLSTSQSNVYQRVITSPFSGGSVIAQIRTTNGPTILAARIVGTATVGKVTQTANLQVQMGFGYGGAVVSDNFGSSANGVSKATAQQGNVVFKASAQPARNFAFVLDGGGDYVVRANSMVHIGNNVLIMSSGLISEANANTANEIPDYTAEGSSDQLFDFQRFIAVADLTPSGPSPSSNNHFTNMAAFRASLLTNTAANPYQGVIVVDIRMYNGKAKGKSVLSGDFVDLTASAYPNGINVRGTLIFNFAADVEPSDRLIISAALNINAADLSGLILADPATYTTGYPATYSDPAKNPMNIDITSAGFKNFAAGDDLPALMYNIGNLYIGGNANICGVVYTPSFMEIENREDGQFQYFKGSLIGGGGVYVENLKDSGTIVSYDPNALDLLATSGKKGYRLKAMYWQ